MDDFFSTFLYILVIGFFIFIRLRKSKKNESQRKTWIPPQRPAEKPVVLSRIPQTDAAEDDIVEAAWRTFRAVSESAIPRSSSPVSVIEKTVADVPKHTTAPISAVLPADTEKKDTPPQKQNVLAAGFSRRFEKLSFLQKAIVMSEVLGKPKALRTNRDEGF